MSIYSDKLAHVQVFINCPYYVAQMCTHEESEDKLTHILGASYIDDVMSYNSLTTLMFLLFRSGNSLLNLFGAPRRRECFMKYNQSDKNLARTDLVVVLAMIVFLMLLVFECPVQRGFEYHSKSVSKW